MNIKMQKTAVAAVLLVAANVASAAARPLPTPAASAFPDRESSVNVALPDWPALGRRILLALSAHATGSNAVQVAFGQDANGDEDLEPEETQLVVGVDCGEWFARDERPGSPRPLVLEDWVPDPSSTNALRAIRIRQAASVPERFDFAKVTVRGVDDPAAEIAAEITRPGIALMIR